MNRILISLGANLGDPNLAVREAAHRLQQLFASPQSAFRLSGLYRTPPVGGPSGQPPFINAVIAIESALDPWQAWSIVRRVESELGRVRQRRWEARKIDVDILLHADHRIWTPQLKIPHPRMCMRRFILAPAREIADQWIDPVSKLTIQQLADRLDKGAANLSVLAPSSPRSKTILENAARSARATWKMPGRKIANGRWVQLFDTDQELSSAETEPRSNLTVHLTPQLHVEGAQWEDVHAPLAQRLGFKAPSPNSPATATVEAGPRYLLASDDAQWASHEIAAALDAMDCLVERLPNENRQT